MVTQPVNPACTQETEKDNRHVFKVILNFTVSSYLKREGEEEREEGGKKRRRRRRIKRKRKERNSKMVF